MSEIKAAGIALSNKRTDKPMRIPARYPQGLLSIRESSGKVSQKKEEHRSRENKGKARKEAQRKDTKQVNTYVCAMKMQESF